MRTWSNVGFAECVVVRDVRAAEAAPSPERRKQLRQRVALHRGSAIRVYRQAGLDLWRAIVSAQRSRAAQCLQSSEATIQPVDVPAEQVDNHVRVQEDAHRRRGENTAVTVPGLED
jgi:hypothetical protein